MKHVTIDVGGTFTDCLVMDESGEIRAYKAPTTPRDLSAGLLSALEKAAASHGQPLSEFVGSLSLVVHGTTLATNALLTGRGVKTGLITTKGFRDILQMRRGYKVIGASMYNMFVPPYEPLVPRYLRLGVEERTLSDGEVLTPLSADQVRQAVARLKAEGVESVAICFLHSYANPANEQRAKEIAKGQLNGTYVTTSHEILPVWREFERFSTTVVSAYIGPLVVNYLTELEQRLARAGLGGSLLMMLSSGLTETVDYCLPRPVHLIGSGPAAAPAAGLYVAGSQGLKNLISVDMGGTSFDVCLIRDGEIPATTESWVGNERVAIKLVDVQSGGSGGGSIGWIDSLDLVRVGPQSAGAEPGPAAYGKGGTEPTVTDANVVLGYVPADYFLGGEIPLYPELARQAMQKIAEPLGLSRLEAAEAIFAAVNTDMANQVSKVTTKRGYDVRDFALVVGGGAGPVHAAFVADLLEIEMVIIPPVAALYSAFGMFAMDLGRNFARSYIARADRLDMERVNRLYDEMEAEGRAALRAIEVPDEQMTFKRTVDMRYIGQFHEVEVDVPAGALTRESLDEIIPAFHQRHEDLYTFRMPWKGVEFLTFRVRATAPSRPFHLKQIASGDEDASHALKRRRTCVFGGREVDAPVYDGDQLLAGNAIPGPSIIEERTTTVVIPEGFRCTVDQFRNYVLRKEGS
jgi:N-methylhydantoinase A